MSHVRRLDELPNHALQVLAELETLMDDDGRGHDRDDEPEYLTHRRRMLECEHTDLTAIVEQAARELAHIRRREIPAVDRYDVRAVVLRECRGWSPTDVERSSHKASARSVRKWRTTAGMDPETGHLLPGTVDIDRDPARVTELRERGYSLRAITQLTGIPKDSVHRLLRKEAA